MAGGSKISGNSVQSGMTKLCLLRDEKLTITGHTSGKIYYFNGAGSIVEVQDEDVDYFLGLRVGGCCGSPASPHFEVVR